MFFSRLDGSPDLELLNIGDRVLEVNGVTVKEQSLDEVRCFFNIRLCIKIRQVRREMFKGRSRN